MTAAFIKTYFTLTLLLFTTLLTAQTIRGLHVNDFKHIIGNEEKENDLLQFAQQHGYNYLLLYNLNYIHNNLYNLSNAADAAVLANFIFKAKRQYGMLQIGGVGEKYKSFIPQFTYNERYADLPDYQIDVYSVEFEFWNPNLYGPGKNYCDYYLEDAGLPCTQEGAFTYYLEQLQEIKKLTVDTDILLETYIGTPSEEQCELIARMVDRVMVHYYRTSDTYNDGRSIYQYNAYRIQALAAAEKHIDVIPLFNAKPEFMGSWLETNSIEQAFITLMFGNNGYNQQAGEWKEFIHIEGYQWYRYSDVRESLDPGYAPPFLTSTEEEFVVDFSVRTFPNPVVDELNISWDATSKVTNVFINGVDGQMVYRQPIMRQQEIIVDTRNLPKGMLVVMVETEDGMVRKKVLNN